MELHESAAVMFRCTCSRERTERVLLSLGEAELRSIIAEQGAIEVDKLGFSLEPFLYLNDTLVTWADVHPEQSLEDDYLPIPSVVWKRGGIELTVRAFNQELLDKDLIEEQLIFYTLEKRQNLWRFLDARTYRSGLFDQEYLVSLLEQLV